MNIKERKKKFKEAFDKEAQKTDERLSKLLKGKSPKSLYDPCTYVLKSGGKHLRGYLVLLSTKVVGGKYSEANNAALSVEILHNFTLVHDDIMDNADKRRGVSSLHIKFDVNTAILAGDILIALAYENLLKDCKTNTLNILNTFNQSVIDVCEGQSLDKEFEERLDVTIPEYIQMIQKKTGALIQMCCSIGGQIGNGNRGQIKALEKYGKNLGLAFQLKDDLLDIVGDTNQFGKSVGGDLVEGKKTYMLLKAIELANKKDKIELNKIVRNSGIKRSEIEMYKNLYLKYNVFDIASQEITQYTDNAIHALKAFPESIEKDNLIWLAQLLIERKK